MTEPGGREPSPTSSSPAVHEVSLRRAGGPWGSYTWGYADVGADVYVALGLVMAAAQGLTNLAFLFAGLVYISGGLAYTELSSAYPLAGGGQFFVLRGLGDFWGFVAGWAVLLDFTIDISLFSLSSAGYVSFFIPALRSTADISLLGQTFHGTQPWLIVLSTGLVVALTGLNVLGVRESIRFNELLGGLDIFSESAIIIFVGLESISQAAQEPVRPATVVPRTSVGLIVTVLIYALAFSNLGLGMLPWQSFAPHTEDPIAWMAAHIPYLGLVAGFYVAALGATLLLISSNAGIFGASRITYSMARYRLLPRWFSWVHPRFRTPVRTLLTFSGVALLELWLAGLSRNALDVLGNMYAFGAASAYILVFISLFVLRAKDPITPRPFRIPLNVRIGFAEYSIVGCLGSSGSAASWSWSS